MMLAIDTKFSSIFGIKIEKKTPLKFIQTKSICETLVQIFFRVYFALLTWARFGSLLQNRLRQTSIQHPLFALFFYAFDWSFRQSFSSSSSNFILGCPTYVLSVDLFLNFLNPSCFNQTSRSDATDDSYLASPSEVHRTRWSVLMIFPAITTCSFKIQNMTKSHIKYPDDSPR